MKINQLKINAYGKIKEKEIKLKDHLNIIYGKNEDGKSTLLNFIISSFYGIAKNKNGKEIADFDKYTPWVGEEFSGKIEYQLDNQEKFEIFRDFKKKNPKIYNEGMEDITKQFNIDKNKGNEFFYEQTKVDQSLFLSTVISEQQAVKLENKDQNILIQKVANLIGTGEDNVSYKRAIDRINRRLLEEIGTERTREKPLNKITQNIIQLEKEKQQLETSVNIKYEIEEKKNNLSEEIKKIETQNEILKQEKILQENNKIEEEKIKIKQNLKKENEEKIEKIKNEIEKINSQNKNIFEKNEKENLEKNKKNIYIFLIIIISNLLQFIFIKNKLFNYIFLLTVPMTLIFLLFSKNKIKNNKKIIKNKLEKIKEEKNKLNYEINLLQKNNEKLEEEIKEKTLEKPKTKTLEKINLEIQNLENEIRDKKIELHTLQLDYQNIEPKLEKLANLEERLVDNKEKMVNLKNLEASINLAKETLEASYEKMKNTVTPKFTDKLSEAIAKTTNQKYQKVKLNDETRTHSRIRKWKLHTS